MFNKVRNFQSGLTLIELMIAMVLGLVLLLGVSNVFLSQRQAYRVNENLARMQDSARTAFELMAREIREAGGNPCGTPNVDNTVAGLNWDDGGLEGFGSDDSLPAIFDEAENERVAGTDALIVRSGSLNNGVVIAQHQTGPSRFTVNTKTHGLSVGQVLMACDYRKAAIFSVTSAPDESDTIDYDGAVSLDPFEANGFLTRVSVTAWYIGNNSRGGSSLFRMRDGVRQEIAEGVSSMELRYLLRTAADPDPSYVAASSVGSWANDANARVVAVRVFLDLVSRDTVGTDADTLKRTLVHVVSLRHREIVEK